MEHPEIAAADRLAYCARSRLRDLCNPRLTDGQRRRWILQVTRALRCMVDMPPDTNQELRLHVFFRSLSYTGLGLREGGEPKRTKATFVRMAKDFGSDLAAKHSGASDRAVLLAARAWARMSRGGQIAWSPIVALAAEVGFSMTAESLRTSLPARHYKAIVTRAINRSTARAGNAEPS
jgi:hypothetical protein